ncbi:MFS transporter [Caulobacter segnis]|uniref:Major facilitator superfamily MFS_1 n=2 Tax=Caulobacter segnis TaxID=88688 RepID=D5VII5_CAUST|nr:MFS transporter [Caulobacter segnis]ADG09559.1 major facilitator superfamily MFS_1 [Caulobacter segnis ATCC 21756]AVQ01342.1 MFS transporter [Caulobacter segnis]
MTTAHRRPFGQNYAFVVAGAIFLALLAAAALRAAPGVLMLPLEKAFGWDRASISLAAAIGIFLYGLTGPFAAALMNSFGLRRTVTLALLLMALSTGLSAFMTTSWQYVATWGVLAGLGSGAVAMVLGATVVNRWFVARRGLMLGLLTASTATGSLIFLPGMAFIAEHGGWKPVVITIAAVCLALAPLTWLLIPERPADVGLKPFGAPEDYEAPPPINAGGALAYAFQALGRAARTRTFWLLFLGFFICGLTTNGLIGVHMIAFCGDRGMPEVRAAGLLALMGLFDLFGTTASGWLTDRYDSRKLLFVYYVLRGLSLIYLPFSDFSVVSLSAFAVFYGLDWIATVPPTVCLATEAFGDRDGPIVFGWIAAGHQLGAATAAIGAGAIRASQGQYVEAFIIAGTAGLVAGVASLMIRRAVPRPAMA